MESFYSSDDCEVASRNQSGHRKQKHEENCEQTEVSIKRKYLSDSDTKMRLKRKSKDKQKSQRSLDYSSKKTKKIKQHDGSLRKKKKKGSDDEEDDIELRHSSSDDVNDSQNSSDDDVSDDKEYTAIREEIANMPFEDLIKLKERLGTKAYNQVICKDKSHTGKQVFKRENKNRPMEMSSKKRVPVIRDVIPTKKKIHRDPRFDDLSGEYKEEIFKKSYSFLDDIKVRERQKVEKRLKKIKNNEKKQELQYLLNRMKQQEMASTQKQKRQELEKKWKEKEKDRVKEGKAPFYLKKADLRKLELAEKYRELKKSGKVDKYLSKKRKKTAQKEKKKLPLSAKQFGFT